MSSNDIENKTKVWILWILIWIWLSSSFPVEGIEHDTTCYDNCDCCKNNICHTDEKYNWNNVCKHGCIGGHRGARCYEICSYNNCLSCLKRPDNCDKCYEGFYPGPIKDCKSECPSACKECISNTSCTSCKDGYYDKEGSTTCQYHICPENCECNGSVCVTCKNGFFDTAAKCSRECPPNCVACSSKNLCDECKNNFYNGYEFDNNAGPLFNNCTLRCKDACTKCHSYDNCLLCVKGKYGQKCQDNCSVGCKDRICHIKYGDCICSSNFVGDKCNECVNGKYGTNCNTDCPENCKNGKCKKKFGTL
ncbi:cell death abnormality protein 1-like [Mercenaria mercenaria]|uniref:cell death abnormality protein 1-like n=1 Tax=Mercenaria mercenaria TaxID=6596 RepID=UPI00234F4FF3|nr:cell death abnormality protein 1-like [Mercenaria mercenaria]